MTKIIDFVKAKRKKEKKDKQKFISKLLDIQVELLKKEDKDNE